MWKGAHLWFPPLNHGTCCSWAFVLLDTQGCLYPLDLEPINFFPTEFTVPSWILGVFFSDSRPCGLVCKYRESWRMPFRFGWWNGRGFCKLSKQVASLDCDLSIGTAGNSGYPSPQGSKYCSRLFLRNLDKQVGCSSCTWKISCQLSWLCEYRLGVCGVLWVRPELEVFFFL